jgi:hypothetical protein
MQSVKSIHTPTPLRDRLGLRLALLFFLAFLGTLVVIGAWALMGKIAERSQAATEVNVQAPAIVIDPKIQQDLAKAMTFDATPAVTQVQNPFVDRANLASSATAAAASVSKPNAGSTTSVGSTQTSGSTGQSSNPSSSSAGSQLGAFMPPVDNTKARYEEWLERSKRGEFVVPESEVLGVGDLVPVGYATGGDRGPEVILMSLSLCRTFTFPAGTRLFDGILNAFDQREVVFVFQNGIRRKSYSTQDVCRPQEGSGATSAGISN